jgi:hypothetical protein
LRLGVGFRAVGQTPITAFQEQDSKILFRLAGNLMKAPET